MTEILYQERGNHVRVSLHGHAAYNPGNDPVCAGISAITFQLLRYLEALEQEQSIHSFAYEVEEGSVTVDFIVEEGDMDAWHIAWKVIGGGYRNLCEAYPENVQMN